jgi:hypothetical protein
MRYDIVLIGAGIVCLLGGEGLGLWMASHEDFTLAPAHAHLNLVGWVSLSLYGLAHRAYPALAQSRLAAAQAIVSIVAAVTAPFTIAYTLLGGSPLPAILNSLLIVLGTILFALMFFRRAGKA